MDRWNTSESFQYHAYLLISLRPYAQYLTIMKPRKALNEQPPMNDPEKRNYEVAYIRRHYCYVTKSRTNEIANMVYDNEATLYEGWH